MSLATAAVRGTGDCHTLHPMKTDLGDRLCRLSPRPSDYEVHHEICADGRPGRHMAKQVWLQRSFERKVLGGFLAAALVVVALAATTWKLAADAREAARLVSHTYQVVQTITEARADTLQIEFSTQSYRISGDAAALKERDDRLAAREASLARLQSLISDSSTQMQRWTKLRAVINERIAIAKQVEILRKNQGQEAATAFVSGAPLRETRERTYALFHAMDTEAREVLEYRTAGQLTSQRVLAASGAAVATLLIAMLAATYVLIRRQLAESEATHHALIRSEENLSTTLRSLGDAVLESDSQGRITHMNPAAERLTGWASGEAQGQRVDSVFRLVGQDGQPLDRSLVTTVLATNQVLEEIDGISLVTRTGAHCPIGANAAPIRDESGILRGGPCLSRHHRGTPGKAVHSRAKRTAGATGLRTDRAIARSAGTPAQRDEQRPGDGRVCECRTQVCLCQRAVPTALCPGSQRHHRKHRARGTG